MTFKKPSILLLSSIVFSFGFLYLFSSNPDLLSNINNSETCFILFFVTGLSSALIYYIISTLYM